MTAPTKTPLPKRLLALMLVYAILALSGLFYGRGVILSLLTLMMLLAIMARHKAGLWLLRGYAIIGLVGSTLLPYLLDINPQLQQQLQQSALWHSLDSIPGWLSVGLLIALTMLQLWLVFSAKVSHFFKREINFNIMQ
ncbi:hypothetical protein [Shewanella dokdonensis]|uniref:Uncharacterized protein n=1 Tax=Shewanella dokdonensis TaxID=712036 RepID=A0ABX8DG23_9GAMM|nr:hypothetical protein [Shewanella dokdonensis]MCL1073840.1 hypothetical protein [Shewanella dokdonensis]QVK23625.1 hypothetical protein KHX94_02525 [Shewanella dokdonensis]